MRFSGLFSLEKPKFFRHKTRLLLSGGFFLFLPFLLFLIYLHSTPFSEKDFFTLFSHFFVRFLLPLFTLFFGSSLLAEDWEDELAVYTWVTSTPRPLLWLGKWSLYFVYLYFLSFSSLLFSAALFSFLFSSFSLSQFLFASSILLVLALWVYLNSFLLLSLFFQNSLRAGILFLLFWDLLFSSLSEFYISQIAPFTHLRNLFSHWLSLPGASLKESHSLAFLLFFGGACFVFSLFRFSTMEILLQGEREE